MGASLYVGKATPYIGPISVGRVIRTHRCAVAFSVDGVGGGNVCGPIMPITCMKDCVALLQGRCAMR